MGDRSVDLLLHYLAVFFENGGIGEGFAYKK